MYNRASFMNGLSRKLTAFFASRRFWYVVVGFLAFEALWFVFSSVYPMAFDEDFHLGVIKIYASHWSPFLSGHPAGADQFGAVMRDPSYLYHYLMSFPYRLLTHITHNETAQIIVLRLMNVVMFVYGVTLFRKVMLRAKASPAFTHVALAVFSLIPIVPQLAAHINYDNLLMILLPLLCLTVFDLTDGFRKREVPVRAVLGFLIVSMFISLVKYAALPFVLAAVLFLAGIFIRHFRGHFRELWPAVRRNFATVSRRSKIVLLTSFAVGVVLFAQRYGINFVKYHTPVPDCSKVLTVQQCNAYGPWSRDYYFEQEKPSEFNANPFNYMQEWLDGMWFRTFFAVNGPASAFTNYRPLTVPGHAAIVILVISLLAVVAWCRKLFAGNAYLIFFGMLIMIYCAFLWVDQYDMYRQTAQPVAINGRYLLPVLPLLAVILGRALSLAATKIKRAKQRTNLKAAVAVLALVLFLHGGGLFTFILRSDDTWYWPNSTVRKVNETSQKILAPITVEGSKW